MEHGITTGTRAPEVLEGMLGAAMEAFSATSITQQHFQILSFVFHKPFRVVFIKALINGQKLWLVDTIRMHGNEDALASRLKMLLCLGRCATTI